MASISRRKKVLLSVMFTLKCLLVAESLLMQMPFVKFLRFFNYDQESYNELAAEF